MMSQAVQPATAGGYQPPRNTQFSVFLANRVGRLLELLQALEAPALRVAALSIVDSADHSAVRVVTSRAELALRLLERHSLPYAMVDVLVVELPRHKTLACICQALVSAEVNIHYMYPLLLSPRGEPAVVVHTDDLVLAGQVLRKRLFTLLGENDLGDNATPGDGNLPAPMPNVD